jgi:hypothetical protein
VTSQEQQEWQKLCLLAVNEADPEKQLAIVAELNRMLQNQRKRPQSARINARLNEMRA